MQYSTTLRTFLNKTYQSNKISDMLINGRIDYDFCDYIAIRGELLTYMPQGREQKFTDSGRWARDGRQEIKPAKLARKIIGDERIKLYDLKDSDFEQFSNLLKSYVTSNGCDEQGVKTTMKVVNGEFITHYYTMDLNMDMVSGSPLSGSCMQGKDEEYFEIYEKNPNVCFMAILQDVEGDMLGRALIWKAQDKYLMDRIYTLDKYMDVFIQFAKDNNIYYKQYQSAGYNYFNMLNGNSVNNFEVRIHLNNYSCNYYPYVDTMKYLCNSVISNETFEGSNYYELNCTGGGFNEHESTPMVYDDHDGCDINEEDAVYMEYRTPSGERFSGYTHQDNVVGACLDMGGRDNRLDCHCVYVDGDYYEQGHSDIVYSEYLGDDAHIDSVVYSEFSEDYIPCDEAIYCEESGNYFLKGDYSNIKTN